jgi:hypothetical protein
MAPFSFSSCFDASLVGFAESEAWRMLRPLLARLTRRQRAQMYGDVVLIPRIQNDCLCVGDEADQEVFERHRERHFDVVDRDYLRD